MSKENETVETKVETAVAQPVVVADTTEVDYEAELKKKDDELVKVREEKENYRKGMLKAKGKLPEEDNLEESLDEKIDRKVQERLLNTRESQVQAEKDALVTSLAKKNKELTLALKNRAQVTDTSASGSNKDRPEVKVDSFFSKEQLESFKVKGWSDKKIEDLKQNMLKAPK